jgi:hypothetical protein
MKNLITLLGLESLAETIEKFPWPIRVLLIAVLGVAIFIAWQIVKMAVRLTLKLAFRLAIATFAALVEFVKVFFAGKKSDSNLSTISQVKVA